MPNLHTGGARLTANDPLPYSPVECPGLDPEPPGGRFGSLGLEVSSPEEDDKEDDEEDDVVSDVEKFFQRTPGLLSWTPDPNWEPSQPP